MHAHIQGNVLFKVLYLSYHFSPVSDGKESLSNRFWEWNALSTHTTNCRSRQFHLTKLYQIYSLYDIQKAKAVALYAMEALGGEDV
jgi:hypothetical protein